MSVLNHHLAVVSESALVEMADLMRVAAALQKQATRDLGPIWGITATVDAFAALEDVPVDYWPMIVRDDIGYAALGIHLDKDGQPFALISSSDDRDQWSLTASHEALEMLVDPFGNRLVAGDSVKPGQGRVNYLVEVCDPSEAAQFAYSINGVLVCDFYTPHFFDPVGAAGVRYSYTGALTHPRQVREGGYLSWQDLATGDWWQQTWFGGAKPRFVKLGQLAADRSIRDQIDRYNSKHVLAAAKQGRGRATLAGMAVSSTTAASTVRAATLREQIRGLVEAS
jgi:hypothetical protein